MDRGEPPATLLGEVSGLPGRAGSQKSGRIRSPPIRALPRPLLRPTRGSKPRRVPEPAEAYCNPQAQTVVDRNRDAAYIPGLNPVVRFAALLQHIDRSI